MVDSWYRLDRVVPEGMSRVSKRLEVVYINGAPSAPGYLQALLRELSHVPRVLTQIAKAKQERKTNQSGISYQFKKGLNRSSRFEPSKISLISFSRGSDPPSSCVAIPHCVGMSLWSASLLVLGSPSRGTRSPNLVLRDFHNWRQISFAALWTSTMWTPLEILSGDFRVHSIDICVTVSIICNHTPTRNLILCSLCTSTL